MADRSGQVKAVAILFLITTWVLVPLRLYCRGYIVKSFGSDDWILCFLQIVFTIYLISQLLGAVAGTGRHKTDITPEANTEALRVSNERSSVVVREFGANTAVLATGQWWFICELLYIISTCALKISVGFSLLRICVRPAYARIIHFLMYATGLVGIVYFLMVLLQCRPMSTFWEQSPRTNDLCFKNSIVLGLTYTIAIMNCLADWAFSILPILVVKHLNMRRSTKVSLSAILGLAALGSIATVVRCFYIPTLLVGDDFLFATTEVALWSTIEPGLGIIATSLAILRPLYRAMKIRIGLYGSQTAEYHIRDTDAVSLYSAAKTAGNLSQSNVFGLFKGATKTESSDNAHMSETRELHVTTELTAPAVAWVSPG
ncbi:hypothetical protein BKA67DRAFT_529592 [Truncatella angustata]|uniref:Rhodopsin domain-containing protein n=1 Tax=Truncatella angustata TaxID=152316 RepID=A0A9P8UUK5_9PEZI|nr:uncharacterized protein BKA67DRAFT_529592 [Truncatella angustata]KAH6659439.1 hypothetical protein BKA67DRAFT_529592 [Truncatella angustata]